MLPNATTVKELFPSDIDVSLFSPIQRNPETVPYYDLLVINTFVRLLEARLIVEFGTARGRTAINMAMNAPDDAEIITIDVQRHLSQYVHPQRTFNIERLVMRSRSFDETPYIGRIGFVFVDGSHEYEDVLSDSHKAMAMVKSDGVILWHDYHHTQVGVTRALDELHEEDERFDGLTRILDSTLAYCRVHEPAAHRRIAMTKAARGAPAMSTRRNSARVSLWRGRPNGDPHAALA